LFLALQYQAVQVRVLEPVFKFIDHSKPLNTWFLSNFTGGIYMARFVIKDSQWEIIQPFVSLKKPREAGQERLTID